MSEKNNDPTTEESIKKVRTEILTESLISKIDELCDRENDSEEPFFTVLDKSDTLIYLSFKDNAGNKCNLRFILEERTDFYSTGDFYISLEIVTPGIESNELIYVDGRTKLKKVSKKLFDLIPIDTETVVDKDCPVYKTYWKLRSSVANKEACVMLKTRYNKINEEALKIRKNLKILETI